MKLTVRRFVFFFINILFNYIIIERKGYYGIILIQIKIALYAHVLLFHSNESNMQCDFSYVLLTDTNARYFDITHFKTETRINEHTVA